jgi:hypothetical protein
VCREPRLAGSFRGGGSVEVAPAAPAAHIFDALFDDFTHSTFRFEVLQSYAVSSEDKRLEAFREGTSRPERSVRTDPWLRRIAVSTAAGKSWSRVQAVEQPLTEYLQYELVSYVESQAVGEQIGITHISAHPRLAASTDFWLFDWATDHPLAVVVHYSKDGRMEERERVVERSRIDQLNQLRLVAEEAAIPLDTYLANSRRA